MALMRVVLSNECKKEGRPSKRRYFANIGLSSVKLVADSHKHAAYHSKHWQRAS